MAQGKVSLGDLHQWLMELSAPGIPALDTSPPQRVDNHGSDAQQPSSVLGGPPPKKDHRWAASQGQGAKFKSHGSTEEPWGVSCRGPVLGQEVFWQTAVLPHLYGHPLVPVQASPLLARLCWWSPGCSPFSVMLTTRFPQQPACLKIGSGWG